jgi:UDP:flavonoid glycosyltransferase YjiC (YdhE family)
MEAENWRRERDAGQYKEEGGGDMRHVFFGLSGGLGPIVRTFPVAEHFAKSGSVVSFSIYGEHSISLLERLGCHVLIDNDPSRPKARYVIHQQPMFYNLDHYYAQLGLLDKTFTETWIRNRIRMLEAAKVDLVISDMSLHTLIAAKVLGIPSISITQSCLHPNGKPLYYWGTPPGNLPQVKPVMNEILRSYHLPEIDKMEDLHRGDMDIVPSIPELDPIYDQSVSYAGPISMNLYSAMALELPRSRPSILVYPGRMRDAAGPTGLHLMEAVVRAFARKDVTVVVATTDTLPKSVLRACSRNIRIIPYFNEAMLEQFDLFIHHGGHGSCLSAIIHGIPSLMIPTQMEREFNARQLHELRVGEYIMPRTFTADHLYQLCNRMMAGECKQRVMRLKAKVKRRKYEGAKGIYRSALHLQTQQKH